MATVSTLSTRENVEACRVTQVSTERSIADTSPHTWVREWKRYSWWVRASMGAWSRDEESRGETLDLGVLKELMCELVSLESDFWS